MGSGALPSRRKAREEAKGKRRKGEGKPGLGVRPIILIACRCRSELSDASHIIVYRSEQNQLCRTQRGQETANKQAARGGIHCMPVCTHLSESSQPWIRERGAKPWSSSSSSSLPQRWVLSGVIGDGTDPGGPAHPSKGTRQREGGKKYPTARKKRGAKRRGAEKTLCNVWWDFDTRCQGRRCVRACLYSK